MFKRAPIRPAKAWTADELPTPRTPGQVLRIDDGKARACVPVPKFAYVRDERLREICRLMNCQHCGRGGPDAGVTWAHSNQSAHGKGKSEKASDIYVAALCWRCHVELDQGKAWGQELKVKLWTLAHEKTVRQAMRDRTWPADIPLPAWATA
ncbi:MAG: hypothetical protein V4792_09915 [Pseudomonadota bacterium]